MQYLRDNAGVLEASADGQTWEAVVLGEGGGGGVTDHTLLTNIGVNSHAQIDTHMANTAIHAEAPGFHALAESASATSATLRGDLFTLADAVTLTLPATSSLSPGASCWVMAVNEAQIAIDATDFIIFLSGAEGEDGQSLDLNGASVLCMYTHSHVWCVLASTGTTAFHVSNPG